MNHVTDTERPRRQLSEIWARVENKSTRREFPPDFLHGAHTIEEVYGTWGPRWVEDAAFLCRTQQSWVVAYFEDYFLVLDVIEDPEQWAADSGRRSVVYFGIGEVAGTAPGALSFDFSRERFRQLEREVLKVTRDDEEYGVRHREADVLSCVGLMAQWDKWG